jgi:hypothetical protein
LADLQIVDPRKTAIELARVLSERTKLVGPDDLARLATGRDGTAVLLLRLVASVMVKSEILTKDELSELVKKTSLIRNGDQFEAEPLPQTVSDSERFERLKAIDAIDQALVDPVRRSKIPKWFIEYYAWFLSAFAEGGEALTRRDIDIVRAMGENLT